MARESPAALALPSDVSPAAFGHALLSGTGCSGFPRGFRPRLAASPASTRWERPGLLTGVTASGPSQPWPVRLQ